MLVRVTTERWKDFSVLHKRERITPLLREETKVAGRQGIVRLLYAQMPKIDNRVGGSRAI